jgi:hypothetical protein
LEEGNINAQQAVLSPNVPKPALTNTL